MEMIFSENPLHAHTKEQASRATESLTCLTIKTGNANCLVYFYPSLYQLTLLKADTEEKIDLGFSGSRLLERLLQTPGEVISREELMSYAWTDRVVGQGSLNQQIYTLRQILGDEKEREIIQTLPRRGYMLNTKYIEVSTTSIAPAPETATSTQPTISAPVTSKPPLQRTPTSILNTFKADMSFAWKIIVRVRLPLVTGLCALTIITTIMAREQQGSTPVISPTKTGLTLTYAPENTAQMLQLVPLGEAISRQLENHTNKPLQLVLGSHENIVTLVCLRADGSARSLHLHENQISTLDKAALAPCL